MKELFYELLNEAVNGKVLIDGDEWPLGFNSIIRKPNEEIRKFNNNNISTLVIKDEEVFFRYLEDYIELEIKKNRKIMKIYDNEYRNKMKIIMSYLFINATTEDFLNPVGLIKKYTNFLEDTTFSYLNEGIEITIDSLLQGGTISIKNSSQSIMMETPNKFEIFIKNNDQEYKLPSVSYGITTNTNGEKECHLYSILNPRDKKELSSEEEKFKKKVNRLLYKINGGVKVAEEKNDEEFNLENISDVSPSAVLSLLIFFMFLKKENITTVKAVPYLPLRYLSRDLASKEVDDLERKEMLIERNNMIQTNITNKFINTIKRVAYHMSGTRIESMPYEYDEFLTVNLENTNSQVVNNEFLKEVSSSVEEKKI